MNMQDEILAAIKKIATDNGYAYRVKGQFSNTGRVYIAPAGTFRNVLNFNYNFQDSYASIQFYPGNCEPVGTCGFTHEKCLNDALVRYHEGRKIEDVLAFVRKQLPPVKTPVTA